MDTVVLQSQHPSRLDGWQGRCCATVESWARRHGFSYRRCGDELFERLPADLRERFAGQPVVLSDLGRLLWLRDVLAEGFARAIWCDADVLVFRDFTPSTGDRVGRECWIQLAGRRLRSYRKVHNAWLQFEAGSVLLPYYIDRAHSLLARARAPVVPQFLGPKLLTAWHNIAPFDVEERVGVLSPLTLRELLDDVTGSRPALDALRRGHDATLCALNLSASCEGRAMDGLCHGREDYEAVIDRLLAGSLAVPGDR